MDSSRPLAVVTGAGRRRGIAAAVVERLALDGWDVAWTTWPGYDARMPWGDDPEATRHLTAVVRQAGGSGLAVEADLSVPTEAARVLDDVQAAFGHPPRALVLCHAESVDSGLVDTTVESFDRHYAVNVRASWLLLREFACRFEGSDGRVVALTSDHTVGNLPYGATKGALDRMVLAAASELAHLRVTANVVNPGATDTGWMDDDLMEQVAARTPLGRVGRPADAARLVAFLCSTDGGWINGQLLRSDGGAAAPP